MPNLVKASAEIIAKKINEACLKKAKYGIFFRSFNFSRLSFFNSIYKNIEVIIEIKIRTRLGKTLGFIARISFPREIGVSAINKFLKNRAKTAINKIITAKIISARTLDIYF